VRLAGERETLGLYLTGHPIAEYERELKPIISGRIADVGGAKPVGAGQRREGQRVAWPGRSVTIAGLVLEIRKRAGRTSFVLDDRSGRLEVTMFDDIYQQFRALVAKDAILVVEGGLRWDDFIDDWRLQAKKILDVDRRASSSRATSCCAGRRPRKMATRASSSSGSNRRSSRARAAWCNVAVRYANTEASSILQFGEKWRVRPSRELIERLNSLVGRDSVELYYAPRE
jgi:DNA polymerase-3 subunit alpha